MPPVQRVRGLPIFLILNEILWGYQPGQVVGRWGKKKKVLKVTSAVVLRVLISIWLGTLSCLYLSMNLAVNRENGGPTGINRTDLFFPTISISAGQRWSSKRCFFFFFTVQPLDLTDSPTELHYTQSPGRQQILHFLLFTEAI